MALFRDLPHEILLEIFSLLGWIDLASTSRVSRRLRTVSEPLLYRAPSLYITDEEQLPQNFHMFLRTLLTPGREVLATHVRSLTLEWDYLEDTLGPETALFAAAASRLGIAQPIVSAGAQAVLLLHLLPRLQVLDVDPPETLDAFSIFMDAQHEVQHTQKLPLGLQSLREYFCCWTSGVSPRTLLTVLKLPCIRTIIVQFSDEVDFPSAMAGLDITSTVTNLRLLNSVVSTSSLAYILKIPRALEQFTFCVRGFDLLSFGNALEPLRNTLQSLTLDFQCVCSRNYRVTDEISTYPIGSLREWPVLYTLRCSMVALLGMGPRGGLPRLLEHVLPAGIRELEILSDQHWPPEEVVDHVVLLLERKEAVAAKLQKVVVLTDWRGNPEHQKLKDACEAVKVELVDGYSFAFTYY